LDFGDVHPLRKDSQLVFAAGLVSRAEVLRIFFSNFDVSTHSLGEVRHKQMLAEGSVAWLESFDRVGLVAFGCKKLLVKVDKVSSSLLKLFQAEVVED